MRRLTPCLASQLAIALLFVLVRALHAEEPPRIPIDRLRSTLNDERASDSEKIQALDELAGLKEYAGVAIPELVALLPRRGALSLHALKALKANKPDEVIAELASRLSSPSLVMRAAAADALIAMADRAGLIVPQMEQILLKGKPDERELACSVLEGLGPAASDALPLLLAELRCNEPQTRSAAIGAARAVVPKTDGRVFVYIADLHADSVHAWQAVNELGGMGEAAALALPDLLAKSEYEASDSIRRQVAEDLAHISQTPQACVPGLIDIAMGKMFDQKQPTAFIRIKSIQRLAEVRPHSSAAIETLVELLPDHQVGDASAQALLSLRSFDEGTVKAIGAMLGDAPEIRRRAAIALQGAGPFAVAALGPLTKALADDEMAVRRDSAIAVAGIGPAAKPAVLELESVIRRGDESSPAGAQALGAIGASAKSAVPALVAAIHAEPVTHPVGSDWDLSARIRSSCAAAVGWIDPNSAAVRELLLHSVRQKDWVVREALATTMVDSRTRDQIVPSLQVLAADHDELVRVNARCALRELDRPPTTQPAKGP